MEIACLLLIDDESKIGSGYLGRLNGRALDWFPGVRIDLEHEPSGVATAVYEAAPFSVYDAAASKIVSKRLVETIGAKSLAFIPLIVAERVIAVLVAGAASERRAFTPDELNALQELARERAAALDRARSTLDLAEALERERFVARISARSATSTTPTGSRTSKCTGGTAKTNKTSQTAFRGFGGPQGMIVIEDILGRCAPAAWPGAPRELGRCNFYTAGTDHPVRPGRAPPGAHRAVPGSQVLETGDVRSATGRDEGLQRHPRKHQAGRSRSPPVKFGISFNLTAFNQAGALVHVYKDGSVLINHGGTEMGQGLHTKMMQVAATALGVPLERSGWPRPGPTRCPTPRPPRPARAPTSTAAR